MVNEETSPHCKLLISQPNTPARAVWFSRLLRGNLSSDSAQCERLEMEAIPHGWMTSQLVALGSYVERCKAPTPSCFIIRHRPPAVNLHVAMRLA
ncbi:hypothetical protein Q1695_008705 [Nippostrongylus brasiliensis]|nr:hypothetical protein Q1695_008705 [Nippostrongylus brasiliensis]